MAMNYGGIMYFPLNVNFFEDGPIELVEAKYGLEGKQRCEAAVQDVQGKGILPPVGGRAMHALLT